MENAVEIGSERDLSSIDINDVNKAMLQYGFIHFITKCKLDPEIFIEFSDKFNEKFMPYIGGGVNRKTYNEDPTVLYADQGEDQGESIELHGEQHYQFDKPDKIWFFCLCPSASGGESFLADGVRIFQNLPDKLRNIYEKQRIMYRMYMIEEKWRSIFQCSDKEPIVAKFDKLKEQLAGRFDFAFLGDALTYSYKVSAIPEIFSGERAFINNLISLNYSLPHLSKKNSKTIYAETLFEDGSEIPRSVLDQTYAVAKRCTEEILLRSSSFIMVDNRRVMHGRARYEGNEREILVRISKLL